MIEMYKGIANSPEAELTESISAQATIIKVSNINAFPEAPNLATIGTDENAETIRYAVKTADSLSGCERGIEGTARSWQTGEIIARNFTNKDHADLVDNVKELNESKANQQEVTSLTQTVNGLTQTVAGKASQQDLESLRIEVSMAGGLKVVDGSFNNNQISVTGFTPAEDVPFLLNLTSVYRNTMEIGNDTRIRFGNGGLTRLTKFNNVTFNEATIIKQRQFICVKKSDVVWIEVYPAELDNKIFDLKQRVEEAFQSASEGKNSIVSAFTGLDIQVNANETFNSLADKVRNKTISREKIANALTNKGIPTNTNSTQQQIIQNIASLSVPTFIDFSTKSKDDFITNYSGDLRRYSDNRTVIVDGTYTTSRQYGMYKIPHNFSGSERYLVLVDPSAANSNGKTLAAAFYPYITNDTRFLTGTPVSSLVLKPLTPLTPPVNYGYNSYGATIIYKIPNGTTGNYYFVFGNTRDSSDYYYIFNVAMQGLLII